MNVDRTTEGTPTIAAGVLTAVCTTWVVVALIHATSLTDETRPMWVVIHIAQLVFAPILFTAAAGTRVNSANRYVAWRVVLALAATGMVAAPLAALAAQEIPAQTLGRLFAVWLLIVAARTLWKARPASK